VLQQPQYPLGPTFETWILVGSVSLDDVKVVANKADRNAWGPTKYVLVADSNAAVDHVTASLMCLAFAKSQKWELTDAKAIVCRAKLLAKSPVRGRKIIPGSWVFKAGSFYTYVDAAAPVDLVRYLELIS
jgi:hypothetical protein